MSGTQTIEDRIAALEVHQQQLETDNAALRADLTAALSRVETLETASEGVASVVQKFPLVLHVACESRGMMDAHYWQHPSRDTYTDLADWMLQYG